MISSTDSLTFDFKALGESLKDAPATELRQTIVDAPFSLCRPQTALIFLGIIVLLVVDDDAGTINRVALSETELAKNTTNVSYVPFDQIRVPLGDPENIISKAVRTGEPQDTTDWRYLFTPALNAEQARINQASGGIAYSAVYPLSKDGAMIFSYFQYQQNIGHAQRQFMEKYTNLVDKFNYQKG